MIVSIKKEVKEMIFEFSRNNRKINKYLNPNYLHCSVDLNHNVNYYFSEI